MLRDVALDAEVFSPGLPLLDVRLIWDTEANDVNPVELSVAAGAKRAGSIAAPVGEHNLGRGHSTIFLWICDLIIEPCALDDRSPLICQDEAWVPEGRLGILPTTMTDETRTEGASSRAYETGRRCGGLLVPSSRRTREGQAVDTQPIGG